MAPHLHCANGASCRRRPLGVENCDTHAHVISALSARGSPASCSCEGLLTLFFRHLLRSSDPRPAGPNAPTPTARPLPLPEIGYHTTWHSLSYKKNNPWKPLMLASNASICPFAALGVIAPLADTSRRQRENLLRAMGASTAMQRTECEVESSTAEGNHSNGT